MKFTQEQIKEIKRLIYISNVSYIELQNDRINKIYDMLGDILQ